MVNQPDIEAVFVEALQNIAEGVTDLLGFEVAAISIARDDHTLEMVVVAGSAEAREQLLGHRTPISQIERELATAEEWGDLRFVPHERMSIEVEELGWVPDLEPSDDPDAWHPLDLLLAPIHDEHQRLRGLLSVDLPHDRRRPGAAQREQLQRYARQTRRSVLTAVERAQFAEHVRLAEAARKIVREVSSELSISRIVEICQPAVTAGFNAVGMWLQTFDAAGGGADAVYGATEGDIVVPDEFKMVGREAARVLWARQEVAVITLGSVPEIPGLVLDEGQVQRLHDFMEVTLEASSMLFVPIGAGPECLGNVALTRRGPSTDWSPVERQTALEIGHDLGRALVNARTFERERHLLEELRELAGYKSRLIATISHELKNPLASILGHLDLIGLEPDLTSSMTESTTAIGRAAERMRSIVDDLLLLAQVADPNTVLDPAPVDLAAVVDEVLDLLRVTVEQKNQRVVVEVPAAPVYAWGEAQELFQVCANLISNAVKYTPADGTITVSLARTADDVELVVADTGIGVSAADQHRLFDEFFRSTNPAAKATPGTGLGLSIVHRIIERHHGRIAVASDLGAGTTFTVTLPPAPEQAAGPPAAGVPART
ncbi:MAG TPA: HAMP domain-containing sensor histidine kinase [Nocardioides sp.]|nr:HAMP domain-containing sensor histidine kinase [Nocardioides sp.]